MKEMEKMTRKEFKEELLYYMMDVTERIEAALIKLGEKSLEEVRQLIDPYTKYVSIDFECQGYSLRYEGLGDLGSLYKSVESERDGHKKDWIFQRLLYIGDKGDNNE